MSTPKQPETLRLADELCEALPDFPEPTGLEKAAAAEMRRLYQVEFALKEWISKTEWIQKTAQPLELGLHYADAIKLRLDRLHAQRTNLLETLQSIAEERSDPGARACALDAIANATA